MNRPDWANSSPYPRSLYQQSSDDSTAVTRVTTTIAILILGYYALFFFELWPSTFKRRAYETCLDLLPPRFIILTQSVMTRVGALSRDGVRFKLEDLSTRQAKSDVLRELLGFENSRITTVVRKARTFSGIDNILPLSTEIGPAGLGNWDNSCYQNSVLHGFASLPAFNQFVSNSWDLIRQNDPMAPTHEALVSFLAKLNASDQPKRTLWTPAVLKSMDSWQQQDAQEYFSRVLDAVEKEDLKFYKTHRRKSGLEMLPADRTNATLGHVKVAEPEDVAMEDKSVQADQQQQHMEPIEGRMSTDRMARFPDRNPLDGMLAQSLKCRTCGFTEGLSLTQFNCITVNLGTAGGSCTLERLLDEYTEPEDIDGVECTQCTKNAHENLKPASGTPASAGLEMEADRKSNSALISNLQDESLKAEQARKKPKPVLSTKSKQLTLGRLPQDLVIHLNRSIFDVYGDQRKNTALVAFPLRLSILNRWCAPLDDMDSGSSQAAYTLHCVVTHAGRHDDGHYIAYAKRDKHWYCFNDEVVTKVSEEFVFNRGNAFMLFYEVDGMAVSSESNSIRRDIRDEVFGDELFEDTSVPTLMEKEASEHVLRTKQVEIDQPPLVEAIKEMQTSLPAPSTTETSPYDSGTTPLPEEADDGAISHSTATSEADLEEHSPSQPHIGTFIPPMRTASESPTIYRQIESSHAAPVF